MPKMSWEEAVRWLRAQPDKQELVRACFFDDPLLDAARRFQASLEWQSVRAFLPQEQGEALDVGAGRGIASFALAEEGWKVTALEPDPSDLVGAGAVAALADASGHPFRIVQEWGETLPFPDASFDLVYARQVLHHARDLEKLCAELARVLKPGGVLIATREHVIDTPEELEIFRAQHALHHLYGGECAFALEHYLEAISRSGLLFEHIAAPFSSPVNFFPTDPETLLHTAQEAWNWDFPMGKETMLAQLNRTLAYPGRLYTFVARRAASADTLDTAALLSRILLLEAKLDAREIAVRKHGNAIKTRVEKRMTEMEIKLAASEEQIKMKLSALEQNLFVRCAQKLHTWLRRLRHLFS